MITRNVIEILSCFACDYISNQYADESNNFILRGPVYRLDVQSISIR